jgi:hypothetical protein
VAPGSGATGSVAPLQDGRLLPVEASCTNEIDEMLAKVQRVAFPRCPTFNHVYHSSLLMGAPSIPVSDPMLYQDSKHLLTFLESAL